MFDFFDEVIDEVFIDGEGLLFHGGGEIFHAVVDICCVEVREIGHEIAVGLYFVVGEGFALPGIAELTEFFDDYFMVFFNFILKWTCLHEIR